MCNLLFFSFFFVFSARSTQTGGVQPEHDLLIYIKLVTQKISHLACLRSPIAAITHTPALFHQLPALKVKNVPEYFINPEKG